MVVLCAAAVQRSPERVVGTALGTCGEGRPQPSRDRTELDHRAHAVAVHDATCRDHGQIGAIREKAGQRHGPEQVVLAVRVEDAAPPASKPWATTASTPAR
jgi:hypothetical protein